MQDLGLMRRDGFTEYTLNDADFTTTEETRKSKDGEIVTTGVTKRVFVYRVNNTQLKDGEGATAVLPNGEAAVVRELRITERYLSKDARDAAVEADRVKNMVGNLRRYLGLSKSTKVVADRDKLTPQDVANWMNGNRQLFGKVFDTLPTATQEAVSKVYADSIKMPKSKAPTMSQLAEMAALAAENGTPLSAEWHEQYNAIKARAAKLQKGKAVEPEVILTEQGND